jgi:hypothetical protein
MRSESSGKDKGRSKVLVTVGLADIGFLSQEDLRNLGISEVCQVTTVELDEPS